MDIQPYIDKIMEAKNGAEMRNPIASVLKDLYEDGKNADFLVGTDGIKRVAVFDNPKIWDENGTYKPGDFVYNIFTGERFLCVKEHSGPWKTVDFEEIKLLVRKDDFKKYTPLDSYPDKNSKKLVTSTGIFAMIGDLSTLEV